MIRRLPALPNTRILRAQRGRQIPNPFTPRTMRTLSFEPDDRRYERIYALLVTGAPNKDRHAMRIHGEILDKLEAIGQVKPAQDDKGEPRPHMRDELRFYVTVSGGDVVIEEAAYELIKQRCVDAIPGVHVSLSRDLEKTIVWLEGLPKQDAKAATA